MGPSNNIIWNVPKRKRDIFVKLRFTWWYDKVIKNINIEEQSYYLSSLLIMSVTELGRLGAPIKSQICKS